VSLRGTAVQYKPGRWLTAAHLIKGVGPTMKLRLGGAWVEASVVFRHETADLAVLECSTAHPWLASLMLDVPDEGDTVRVAGWTRSKGSRRLIRVALDYVVQGESDGQELMVTGPNPQRGLGGGPAIEMRSGRTFGIFSKFSVSDAAAGSSEPAPLQESYIACLRQLPVGIL